MSEYAGFDVSDKMTTICVVDAEGVILKRDTAPSDPALLAKWLARHCPHLARVVLETGPLSTFLYHGLAERGVPVACICEIWGHYTLFCYLPCAGKRQGPAKLRIYSEDIAGREEWPDRAQSPSYWNRHSHCRHREADDPSGAVALGRLTTE